MLKSLDLFGVQFVFRVENYKKFTSQTGGVFFLIYFSIIFGYLIYGLYDYFYNKNFIVEYWDESLFNHPMNFKDQNFNFTFFRNEDYNITSFYKNENKLTPIAEKPCEKDKVCFDNKKDQIIVFENNKYKYIKYLITPNIKKEKYFFNLTYPINMVNTYSNFQEYITPKFIISPKKYLLSRILLQKSIYIYDDNWIFPSNKTQKILNLGSTTNYYSPRDENDLKSPILEIRVFQEKSIKVKYTRRKRIYTFLSDWLSLATTLLANFNVIVSILNTNKAKMSIFEEIFHINSNDDMLNNRRNNMYGRNIDIDLKDISDRKELNKLFNNSLRKDDSNLDSLDKKDERRKDISKMQIDLNNKYEDRNLASTDKLQLEKEKKIRDENIQKIKDRLNEKKLKKEIEKDKRKDGSIIINEKKNIINDLKENDINDNENQIEDEYNLIKERLIAIEKKYPTINPKNNYKNDPRFIRNIFHYTYHLFTCNTKKINIGSKLYSIIDSEFSKSMNIFRFLKRQKRLEIIDNILFDQNERILLNYRSIPLINIDRNIDNRDYKNLYGTDVITIFNEYENINKKLNKTDIERKLNGFLLEKIFNN